MTDLPGSGCHRAPDWPAWGSCFCGSPSAASLPWPHATVLITGVFELLGAFGLLLRAARRWAGWGLMLLTLAVTPANVYMLQHAEAFAVPVWVLVLRLPLQAALFGLIGWCTMPLDSPAPKD